MKTLTRELKNWFIFLCILLLCVFYVGAAAQAKRRSMPAFTLSVYEGNVAVFAYGSAEPAEILDTKIASLPPTEAERLMRGIPADSAEALQRLIEDYCS